MESLKTFFLTHYPKQPETSAGQIAAMSFILVLTFGLLSFFTLGVLGILVVSLLSGFVHATIAHKKPFITGFLPPVIASLVLQFFYFLSFTEVYPWYVSLISVVLNLLPVGVLSGLGAGLVSWLIRSGKKKATNEKLKRDKEKSDFENNLKRLAVVTLFMYATMHILLPVMSRVSASERQDVDTFIKEYEPENDYQPLAIPVVTAPVGSVAVGGAAQASTGEIPRWQEVENKHQSTAAYKQKKQQQQKLEQLKKQNLSYKQIQELAKKGKITGMEMYRLVTNGLSTGKVSWFEGAKYALTSVQQIGEAIGERVMKPLTHAGNWIVKNPLKTAALVIGVLVAVAAVIFIPVVAALAATVAAVSMVALTYMATGIAIGTGLYLGYMYLTGGREAVKQAVFAKETFDLVAKGDLFGAIGSGAIDVFNKVDSLIPVLAIKKVPLMLAKVPGFIGKVGTAIEATKEVRNIRLIINDSSGLLTGGG